MGLGHSQVLGLSARDGAVDVGVTEEARPPAASQEVHGLGELALIARVLALGIQFLVAEVAVPAGDVEGDHDAVTWRDLLHVGADLLDYTYRLQPGDVAPAHQAAEARATGDIPGADRGTG